ncbi:DUF7426 family protein [Corynebacterium striatum]|nr:conserved hypothetical protein [Corynebacterium striatum]
MTNFGNLEEQLDPFDVYFTYRGKQYGFSPSVEDVLAFQIDLNRSRTDGTTEMDVWNRVIALSGGKMSKTGKISGGVLEELTGDGVPFSVIDRFVQAVHLKYANNNDIAKAYFETGELGKALEKLKSDAQRNQATPKDAGETSGDD